MELVDTDATASALAERLNGPHRRRPIVVVTTPSGHPDPWIDIQEIERQVGDVAEVVLMPTGPYSWAFSDRMPALTQVYGGAGRVYPVGHEWATDPLRSPLRFAYSAEEGQRATDQLIDDAMSMAAMAGLAQEPGKTKRRHAAATVASIVANRALVRGDDFLLGNVSPGLAMPGLDIERLLCQGQRVKGWYDEETRWFDVREMVLSPDAALAAYVADDVVLAEVGEVQSDVAEMFLHPHVSVQVGRDHVTANELDDLRTLLTRGEVVPVRVVEVGPEWALSLLDVDDDEPVKPAAALLRGGPEWLVLPEYDATVLEEAQAAAPPRAPGAGIAPVVVEGPEEVQPAPSQSRGGPNPMLLDPMRRHLVPASSPAAVQATAADRQELERLRREVVTLKRQLEDLERSSAMDRQAYQALEARAEKQAAQLASQRMLLRKARKDERRADIPEFADSDQGFRFQVLTAWARRTPLAEQAARPLVDFSIDPRFFGYLEEMEGVALEKVADVVFEVVTGRAASLAGREMHPYRESESGNAPAVTRSSDGAQLMRVNLQTKTASARRLHFWSVPGGRVELLHVGTHDERPPVAG